MNKSKHAHSFFRLDLVSLIQTDLFRYCGQTSARLFLKHFLLTPGFKITCYIRICKRFRKSACLKYTLYPLMKLLYIRATVKYGISIPFECQLGKGFYIGHFGGIVVHHKAIIGDNCNISHGVTIGTSSRGMKKGWPTIGDHVYIGPGAKIFGKITIGNNAAIGANCVVTKDVPENATVAGVPGVVISYQGSEGYIIRTEHHVPNKKSSIN